MNETGQVRETPSVTGLYFYNARYYDGDIGRFVTADNVIDGQYDTQGWNRYAYVKNNPVLYKDPSGNAIVPALLAALAYNNSDTVKSTVDGAVDKIKGVFGRGDEAKGKVEGEMNKAPDGGVPDKIKSETGKGVNFTADSPNNVVTFPNGSRLPVKNGTEYRISDTFRSRINPVTKKPEEHVGIDISVKEGTPLVSVENGTVVRSGFSETLGNVVVVQHPSGMLSEYAHNSKLRVKEGQKVEKGETVALAGSTGLSTGSHSHFEITQNLEYSRFYDKPRTNRKDPQTFEWPK